jgi:multiple sugar transport system permease protein
MRSIVKQYSPPHLFMVVLVLLASVISIVPLYWTFINSLQLNQYTVKFPPDLLLQNLNLDNYRFLFDKTKILRWLLNSVFISSAAAGLIVYMAALAGFPLAKRQFPGVKVLFYIVLAFMTIPKEVVLLPLFMMMKDLKLLDSYMGILLPVIGWPFGVFLMKQFISTVPSEIFDAAEIDGCGEWGTFHRILLPILKPGLGALAVFAFVHVWNDYMWQLIVIKSDTMKTLPLGIASLSDENVSNYGRLMAGAVIGAFPLLAVFAMFQRYFTSGITMGAVKG